KFLGSTYQVEASNGHIRDLPKSQIGVDVENGFQPKYITIRGRSDVLARIRKEAKAASQVYLATDPDREGEAIAWHLAQVLGLPEDAPCRISFNEITKSAVREAIKKARPIDRDLVDAQQARRVLDRLVGYKISPLLWQNVRKRLSAGRVQSAAAHIICQREEEIEKFVSREYWTLDITATAPKQKALLPIRVVVPGRAATLEFESQAQAEKAVQQLKKEEILVQAVKRGQRMQQPQPPFTTSALQQEASRRLGFTTKRTMLVAQQLYEGVDIQGEGTVGLVSYIRTDSVRISEEAQAAARSYIGEKYGADFVPDKPNTFKGRRGAQDAHEAIRPTVITRTPESIKSSLTSEQYRLYKLIYTRFLASQMAPAKYDTVQAEMSAGDFSLRFSGESISFAGCRAAYIESQEEADGGEVVSTSRLPAFEKGDILHMQEAKTVRHETEPPARYTEATLVRTMENLGIGRPSTYAPIISTILERGYVCREGRQLLPTELGRIVNGLMEQHFPNIVDVTFTAGMEDKLDAIEEGEQPFEGVMKEFYGPFEKDLEKAEATMEKVTLQDEVSDVPCEKCGAMMVYKMGRFGKFLACPNFPECRNTKNIVQAIEAPCPKCASPVLARRTRTGRTFYGCSAYPECDFRTWDPLLKQKCPICGGPMVLKRMRGNEIARCMDAACPGQAPVEGRGEGVDE
nr:type I DNA topoisomerase [bacterium]